MNTLTAFFQNNFVIIYFFYGLAFFCMGMAILLESRRASEFHLARAMVPLAGFGIIHGLHEWFEMFGLLSVAGAANVPGWLLLEPVRIAHLVISFALLVVFGVQLIFANRQAEARAQRVAYLSAVTLLVAWAVAWGATVSLLPDSARTGKAVIDIADVLSRYMLGIPGALLAGWAIWLEQRDFRARGMPQFGRALLWSAVALVLYGSVGQIFTRPTAVFPSTVVNSRLFLETFGVPVQLFRTTMALAMALFIIRALRAFEVESEQRLAAAHAARLEVQASARLATEQLNRELQVAVRDLTALHALARALSATLDEAVIIEDVFPRFVSEENRVGAGMILLKREEDSAEIAVATACPTDPQHQITIKAAATTLGRQVAHTGVSAYWNEAHFLPLPDSDRSDVWPSPGEPVRIMAFPLRQRQRIAGALVVCTAPGSPSFTRGDRDLFTTVARQFAAALQNAALYSETQRRDELRGELLRQVVSAQEHERQRIARELHDGPGQTLTALGLGLAATTERLRSDVAAAGRQLAELKELSAGALLELRHIIADLRPSVLDDLGLVAALRSQMQVVEQRSGVRATLNATGPRRRLDPELETIVFRIVQEALTNVVKHAAARHVYVDLAFAEDRLRVSVHDDGRGFDVAEALAGKRRQGWGLLGMQERVALAGGTCAISAQPGDGTRIDVTIPLKEVSLANGQN